MQKKELIHEVASSTGVPSKDVQTVTDAIINIIKTTVAKGEDVSLYHFGIFTSKHRPARQGRNPKNGDTMEIAAKTLPIFKVSKSFTDMLNM